MRPRTTLSFVTLILLVVALASSWTGCSDAPTGADAALDVVAKTRFREALSAELQLEQGDDGFSLPSRTRRCEDARRFSRTARSTSKTHRVNG
jgi:hypothetical protein